MNIVSRLPAVTWFALLLLPNASTLAFANAWDTPSARLALISLWLVSMAWLSVPRRWLVVVSYPLVLAGLVVVGADVLHSVDVLELLAVRYTWHDGEARAALAPYAWVLAAAALAILLLAGLLWRTPAASVRTGTRAAVACIGLVIAFAVPPASWRNAWPLALAGAIADGGLGNAGVELPSRDEVRTSPRNRFEQWNASRDRAPATPETYVLVIGESIRADRLPACGGRPQITGAPDGAVVFCDVVSGSSSTHTSVPLLISRDLPGHADRVPRDASFMKAFEAAGFETFWFGVQERSIAWSDARNQAYEPVPRLDRDALLPLLDEALARPSPRKLIVLHAYNAHAPYRERYRAASAPFPVDASKASGAPTRASIGEWWNDYDNAIDESMRLLRDVASHIDKPGAAAFLLFTPDHAENMLDDSRALLYHALKMPTLWDTSVPGIVWANGSWRAANAEKWQMLEANRALPLMHMDFAPTMLGAANIRYAEPRSLPVDLTARTVPARARFTQVRAGQTLTALQMRSQAK